VMTPLVACLRENETLGQAAGFLLRARTNSAPVVDDQRKLVGVLSEKDLMAAMVSLDSWQLPVAEIMKPNVICYDEDTPIRTVYEFLCRVSIRRIIVVRDGIPTGAISRGTLLRWFKNLVVSKGLVESEQYEEDEGLDSHPAREQMAKTASQLAHQATELQRRFGEDIEDLIPYVVGGATGMQELIDNLLVFSRFANRSGNFEPTPYAGSRAGQP
jgi:two-component system cell cycle response regulator